jgi:GNAT superfamily N-acetyltransferase
MIEIRNFRPDDLDSCVTLFVKVFSAPPWNDQWSTASARAYLEDIVGTPGFHGFVALNESHMMGMCFGHIKRWWKKDEFFIDEMCVVGSRQRQGIGHQLMAHTKQKLSEFGVTHVTLLTAKDTPAEAFYQKQGFANINNLVFMNYDDEARP